MAMQSLNMRSTKIECSRLLIVHNTKDTNEAFLINKATRSYFGFMVNLKHEKQLQQV
jgi:hypothetical protein